MCNEVTLKMFFLLLKITFPRSKDLSLLMIILYWKQ